MRANISVHEPRQPQDKDTMFAFSMEGTTSRPPAFADPVRTGAGLELPQAWNKFRG